MPKITDAGVQYPGWVKVAAALSGKDVSAHKAQFEAAQRDERMVELAEHRQELEIERAKRKHAEEDAERLRQKQQLEAGAQAAEWSAERMAAQAKQESIQPVDPETQAALKRMGEIAPRLSGTPGDEKTAMGSFLAEGREMLTQARLARAKDEITDKLSDTIKLLGTSEIDTQPMIQSLQMAMEAVQVAETPQQVIQAVQTADQAQQKIRAVVAKEHVESDRRVAAIQQIGQMLGPIPDKAAESAMLQRAVQFGLMTPEEGRQEAAKIAYGLKPETAQEVAAKGGKVEDLGKPQFKRAAAAMLTDAQGRALKMLPQYVGNNASETERTEKLDMLMEQQLQRVYDENGWIQTKPERSEQFPLGNIPTDQLPPGWASWLPKVQERPKPVPLEQVQEQMAAGPAPTEGGKPSDSSGESVQPAPQDSARETAMAVSAEIAKKAKAEGWSREKARSELTKALKDMGIQ